MKRREKMTKRKTIEPLEDYLNAPFLKARSEKAEKDKRYAAAVSKAQANIRAMLMGEPKQQRDGCDHD